MPDTPDTCPKCQGQMQEGFILELTHGNGHAVSRWIAGAAIDRTLPLKSLLMSAEVYARQSLRTDEPLEWNTGVGVRYQIAPRWVMDGGIGRALTRSDHAWFLTGGGAYAFGLPWRRR